MSSFSRPSEEEVYVREGAVIGSDATASWGILMIDSDLTKYLFVKRLAEGAQSVALLCQRLEDKQLVVRKTAIVPISPSRASRPDREWKMARLIRSKLDRLPPADRPLFAELLTCANLPAQGPGRFFQGKLVRESFWSFCDGGNLDDLIRYFGGRQDLNDLYALMIVFIPQMLAVMGWMNREGIFHCDAHPGNGFLQWEGDRLRCVLGDFGWTRQGPLVSSEWNATSMICEGAKDKMDPSSVPHDYDYFSNPSDRLAADFGYFAKILYYTLEDRVDVKQPGNQHWQSVFELLSSLKEKGKQDVAEGKLPEAERPPRPNITPEMDAARTLERQYLADGGERQVHRALALWAEKVDVAGRLTPPTFSNKEAALAAADKLLNYRGPYAVVDLSDEASVRAGVISLVAARQVSGSEPGGSSSPDRSGDDTPPTICSDNNSSSASRPKADGLGIDDEAPTGPCATSSYVPTARGQVEVALFLAGAPNAEQHVRDARDRAEKEQAHVQKLVVRRSSPRANVSLNVAATFADVSLQNLREEIARVGRQQHKKGFLSGIRRRFS